MAFYLFSYGIPVVLAFQVASLQSSLLLPACCSMHGYCPMPGAGRTFLTVLPLVAAGA